MYPKFVDNVRDDLRNYAGVVDENARKTERYSVELALEIEEMNKSTLRSDLSLEEMNTQYTTIADDFGNKLLKKADVFDTGAYLSLASGCERVPLTPDVMKQLKIYEQIKPAMLRMYDEVENIDGIFLFDTESNILTFRSEYRLENNFDLPGGDLTILYDLGIIFYDWFKSVDKESNPDRRALWSPMAFIAVEHDWIMNFTAPIYKNKYTEKEKMIGVLATHFNLDWMITSTIEKSAVKMMIVKDDSTLIGLNSPAKKEIKLETFDKNNFSSMNGLDPTTTQNKKKFVYETLNLDHGKSEDIISFALKLKSEFQFRHTLYGKTYTVIREKAPELGLNFIALIDDSK